MKRILATALVLATVITSAFTIKNEDPKKGIKFFEGTFQEALTEAKETNKLIFLDAYAAWCGPCKRMSAYVFTNEQVGEYYNENFINVKMDMEKGEGPVLAQQLRVSAYPTLFFINGEGKVTYNHVGYLPVDGFLNLGKEVNKKQ